MRKIAGLTVISFVLMLLLPSISTAQKSERIKKAKAALETSDNQEIIKQYDLVLKEKLSVKEKEEAYRARGFAKYNTSDYQGASADFSKLIKLEPDNAFNYYKRGDALLLMKSYDKAIIDLSKAVELKGNTTPSSYYAKLGLAYYRNKNYKRAHLNFSKAIEKSPNHTGMFYYRGLAKYKMSNYKGAIKDYNKALQLSPGFDKALFKRGLAKIKAKDFSSAMKDYDRAIKANPNNADAYYNRGLAKKLMKQPHCEDWKKATELGSTAARDRMKECE